MPLDRGTLVEKIAANGLVELMASHSPLSARLVEDAGFDGVWASGFELSALYGLADVSLVSMTQHLDMVRAMTDACALPVIADIDSGFGNAVNVVHAVRQYERAGAAGVVIEDQSFPKFTSLANDGRHVLVRPEEFQGKIEAAVDARRSSSLLVIARTEALIAGQGEQDALARASVYEAAGADLILVHSKQRTPHEIESFSRTWKGRIPIAIVPTAYPEMTVARAKALGNVGMLIYGNHSIRACINAMQQTFARIRAEGGIHGVDRELGPVEEVFRLQRMNEVRDTESRFLR